MNEKLHLIWTQDTEKLTTDIINYISDQIKEVVSYEIVNYDEFANGETKIQLNNSIRGKHNYIIFDVNGKKNVNGKTIKYNDRFLQALLLAKCAKWHWAKTINMVPTTFPYSRQDKITQWWTNEKKAREPYSAQFIKDIFQEILQTDYCITIDVHNPASLSDSWQTNFINLYTWWFVKQAIEDIGQGGILLCPMDQWGDKKISSIARDLKLDYCNVIKHRHSYLANTVEEIKVYGDIENRNVLIHDDILDTWWSLITLIKELKKQNPKSINIAITHGMFNKNAIEELNKLYNQKWFDNIYITNAIYREWLPVFVKTIDSAKLWGNTILSIFKGESINYDNG